MEILVTLLVILVGLAALFAGYRLFRELLPAFGFVVGFFAGAGFIADLIGEGFLSSLLESASASRSASSSRSSHTPGGGSASSS